MGNDIVAHRIVIGLFYHKIGMACCRKVKLIVSFDLYDILHWLILYVHALCRTALTRFRSTYSVISFNLLLISLLLLSGDVEINPGPGGTSNIANENILSIFHCNIRSLRNKLNYIADIIEEFDIVFFTETHLDNQVLDSDIIIEGFETPSRKNRDSRGGGIITYHKSCVNLTRRLDLEHEHVESMWYELKTKLHNILININYRSERQSHIYYWQYFEHMLKQAHDENNNIICLGDMKKKFLGNLPHNVNDILVINGLVNIINKPTHFDARSSNTSLLDPILITDSIPVIDCDTIPIDREISDHDGTYVSIDCGYCNRKTFQRIIWDYKRGDYLLMKNKIIETDWENVIDAEIDINSACSNFTKTFLNIAKTCIPTREVTIRSDDKVWFDSDLRRESRKRDRLRQIFFRTKTETAEKKFKTQRNKFNNLKKQAKQRFYDNINEHLDDLKTVNSKMYWKTIHMLLKNDRSTNELPPLHDPFNNFNLAYDATQKSNVLNKYFCSITKLNDDDAVLPDFHDRCENIISQVIVTEQEVIDMLCTLNANKAVGPDIISNRMLVSVKEEISKPLCSLFNKSLREKVFPSDWKIAHVIPLFKNGDKSLPSNYRPISLLSCVSKVLEKIIFKHVFNHLLENKLLYKFQSGFIPGHSTSHQLIELYHTILLALEAKQVTSVTFADISKAFDTVWVKALLYKLGKYGIKGDLLCWLKSYFSNRTQRVMIKDALSGIGHLHAGVPQGSVLGPLMFLIFINDITDEIVGLGRLFADDTSIGHIAQDESTLRNMINTDLNHLKKWSNSP